MACSSTPRSAVKLKNGLKTSPSRRPGLHSCLLFKAVERSPKPNQMMIPEKAEKLKWKSSLP
ncbi:hypothetical protein N7451_008819 [Penicillium sp. IBT 35674x]|nr:hypothetical protein N7451_008819 [Penicillium sp. IBT 35674x]